MAIHLGLKSILNNSLKSVKVGQKMKLILREINMRLSEYLDVTLRNALGDESTKSETLMKLYGGVKLFTLSDIEKAWREGRGETISNNL